MQITEPDFTMLRSAVGAPLPEELELWVAESRLEGEWFEEVVTSWFSPV